MGLRYMLQPSYEKVAEETFNCLKKSLEKVVIHDKSECLEKSIEGIYQCRKVIFEQ